MTTLRGPLPPIALTASLHPTIWGGRNLASIARKSLPDGVLVGESWETALDTIACNAPYGGESLAALVTQYGTDLIGARAQQVYGLRFPLLAKFLDAQDKLSVQVHPDDTYAYAHESGSLGKTEAWYILAAEPGAEIVYGLERETSEDEVRHAIHETRLEDLLHRSIVQPGDMIFVPAGTIHAIGAGIVLYELQEYSDVTYRLYDYGRRQADGSLRELHVDAGLAVMRYQPPASERVRPVVAASGERVLVGCRYFVLEELLLDGPRAGAERSSSCQIVTLLAGECVISSAAGAVALGQGETAVLPAAIGTHQLRGSSARLLRSYVPTGDDELLRQWRAGQSSSFEEGVM